MALIDIDGYGYYENRLDDNWAAEFVTRALTEHTEATPLDHPDGSVTAEKLAAAAVTSTKVADGAIGTVKLAEASVTAEKLAEASVISSKIADEAVSSSKLADGCVTSSKIAEAAVGASKLADGCVTSSKIAEAAVGTSKLADGCVTSSKIAEAAVGTSKLAEASVTSLKIAEAAVSSSKILSYAVTEDKIDAAAVTTRKLASGAVTEAKLADGAVTAEKLGEDVSETIAKKLEVHIVGALPSSSAYYDFEDGTSLFSTPAIGTSVKGTSTVETDEDGNMYQSIGTGTGTIGASASVLSTLDLGTLTASATDMTVEFDFMYTKNGRMRIALADLDVLSALSNSDIRWNTDGLAADIFSSSGKVFTVCGSGSKRESFFGAWLHARFELDFAAQTLTYEIYLKSDPTDILSGTENFHGACEKVSCIAVYTWLTEDFVYFDNIRIISRVNVDENVLYVIKEDGVWREYLYIDGAPVRLGGSDD